MSVPLAVMASLGASAVAAPFVMKALIAAKSRQTISAHIQEHAHKQGTPTMGGIIALVGILAGFGVGWTEELVAPLVLLIGFAIVGFADDYIVPKMMPGKRGLGWMPKLGLEVGASIAAAWLTGWKEPLQIGAFVFLILFLSNAYNFADGLDSLAGGLGMILCAGLAAAFPSPAMVLVGAVMFVAFIPFLFYNAPPARVFMGDVGALPLGALIGWMVAVALLPTVSEAFLNVGAILPMTLILLVMLAEIVPVPLQIASVKLRKKRLFNFKTPIHHAFQEKGWPETRIVWMFHLVQLSCVVVALCLIHLNSGGK